MDLSSFAASVQQRVAGRGALGGDQVRVSLHAGDVDMGAVRRVSAAYVPGSTPPVHPEGSWLGFVYSKPAFEQAQVHVHAFVPRVERGPGELWVKLKRREAVEQHTGRGSDGAVESARGINEASWRKACSDARAQTRLPALEFGDDVWADSGPAWLDAPLRVEDESGRRRVRCPYTSTPLNVAPRFAGMLYLKLLLPSWLEGEARV